MQDIPRNELLDKLAAGWKVRRKIWANECNIHKNGGATAVPLRDLLKDDWEGEPPGPALIHTKCSITFASKCLRDGAAFIRRSAWLPDKNYSVVLSQHSTIEDILSTDWEVWG